MGDDRWQQDNSPGHFFSRIARGLARVGDTRLRPLGFASAQLPVLRLLGEGARMSQGELARRTRVEQPSMAQLLARMQRDGLVSREPDPTDRRSSLVALTAAAQANLRAGRDVLVEGNKEAMRGLSDAEVDTLLALLRRVLANVERMEA